VNDERPDPVDPAAEPSRPRAPRGAWAKRLLPLGALALFVPLAIVAAQVDDWSRDLSQNRAETADDHADPRLRPVETRLTAEAALARVREVVEGPGFERWSYVARAVDADPPMIALARRSGLFGFVDDITVRVEPARAPGGPLRLHATSQSRVGKGDLGQNPRNLRKLLDALRLELAAGD